MTLFTKKFRTLDPHPPTVKDSLDTFPEADDTAKLFFAFASPLLNQHLLQFEPAGKR